MSKNRKKIISFIADELGIDEAEVTDNARFVEDFGADSLDVMEIIIRFEDEFEIEIPDRDADGFKRVGDVVEYIERLLQIKGS